MKFIELLSEVDFQTCGNALIAAQRVRGNTAQQLAGEIASQIGEGVFEGIMQLLPPNLDEAIAVLTERNIPIDLTPIKREIDLGLLSPPSNLPGINSLILPPQAHTPVKARRGATNEEKIRQYRVWFESGFSRIKLALTENDLVNRLHWLGEAAGLNFEYYVFDAWEEGTGYPHPIRTRYIWPWFEIKGREETIRKGQLFPGIVVFEELGWAGREVWFQIGLGQHDCCKLVTRVGAVIRAEGQGYLKHPKPDWWVYPYTVYDLTRPYDLEESIANKVGRMAQEGEDPKWLWDVYIAGDADLPDSVAQPVFETERLGGSEIQSYFELNRSFVDQGFEDLARALTELMKTS